MSYTRKTTDIFISDELTSILEKIQNGYVVAKLLLKKRHPLEDVVDDYVNYISVSKDDSTKLSYISQERQKQTTDFWDSNRRFMIKPGAFVKKVFKNISEKDIEIFSSLFRSEQTVNNLQFKVVSGRNISQYYNEESYASVRSSLGASCMRYDECQNWFDIYTDNPDQISMLILVNKTGDLVGRSLLWQTTPKVMDRIYTVNDDLFVPQFKKWAQENGYLYKTEQKWNNTFAFTSNGVSTNQHLSIELDNVDFKHYPYLDTFKFLSPSKKTIYNYIPTDVDDIITLSTADGRSNSVEYLALDIKTNLYYQRCDTVFLGYLNGRVFGDSVYYSQTNDCYIHEWDAVYCRFLDDYIFIDNSLNSSSGKIERLKCITGKSELDIETIKKYNLADIPELFV